MDEIMDETSDNINNKKLRFLIIEDSEDDALLLQRELSKAYDFDSERVYTAETLKDALEKNWDAIISDYQMPQFNALNALKILNDSNKDLPFIIVSGIIGEKAAVEAMKAGAHDYLKKDNLTRLIPVIDREIKEAKIRYERDKGIKDLLASAKEWQETFDVIGDLVSIINEDMIILRANKAMFDYFAGKKVIGEHCFHLFHNTEAPPEQCQACKALKNNEAVKFEIVQEAASEEEEHYFSISVFPFGEQKGREKKFIHVFRDITKQKQDEEKQKQGARLQAMGELASGVAHDFNNNLTAIMGFNSLMGMDTTDKTQLSYIATIKSASKRSAELTSQLLAFARKGKNENDTVNIHDIINDIIALLEHSIDKRIKIDSDLQADPSITIGDHNQLSNAILNIALNARDAMEKKPGELKFSTKIIKKEEITTLSNAFSLKGSRYIEIKIRDTGEGIDPKTINKIFDPFFTTKKTKGTGLGLSAAYGTILNHDGAITVESTINIGTTFNIHLPLHSSKGIITSESAETKKLNGAGNIMVVDDEKYITDLVSSMLTHQGYTSLSCLGGREAIALYKKIGEEIDLIILDLMMPDLSGEETFIELKKIDPNVKVLISSGYSKNETIDKLKKMGAIGSLPKPYELKLFASTIKEALEK